MSTPTFPHRFGKLPAKDDPRTLKFERYARFVAPTPPEIYWGFRNPTWGYMRNDTVGDCTVAAAGHMVQLWTTDRGAPFVPPDSEIIRVYSACTLPPYDPATGANDVGAYCHTVLNYWRQKGIAGRKIAAYTWLNWAKTESVKQAIFAFGGVYVGMQLPSNGMTQIYAKRNWELPPGAPLTGGWARGSAGGHAVPCIAYNDYGVQCVTWGRTQWMNWNFFNNFVDEAYAVIGYDWLGAGGRAVNGFNMAALRADLRAL